MFIMFHLLLFTAYATNHTSKPTTDELKDCVSECLSSTKEKSTDVMFYSQS